MSKRYRVCCTKLHLVGKADSPFRKVITHGWYDGNTSGLTECSLCKRAYAFELLAWNYGKAREARIFVFYDIPKDRFQQVVAEGEAYDRVSRPVGVDYWRSPERLRINLLIDASIDPANDPSLVLAAYVFGERILNAKKPETAIKQKIVSLRTEQSFGPDSSENELDYWSDHFNYWSGYLELKGSMLR